jgi:hypothetical protein
MRRYREIGPDGRVIAFFQDLFVVRAKIFAHDFKCEVLVLLSARRSFDVSSEKPPHRVLVAAQISPPSPAAVNLDPLIRLAAFEWEFVHWVAAACGSPR